jgi:lipid II:glycine glycyltransferase (peptidoglycan interpeptide bridge formation enzyme)
MDGTVGPTLLVAAPVDPAPLYVFPDPRTVESERVMVNRIFRKQADQLIETPILQQTAYWSRVKRRLGERALAIDFTFTSDRCCVEADILVVVKQIDAQRTVAYVPYGPALEPEVQNQGAFLEELSESLRSYLPRQCAMIRYDLPWQSYWVGEEDSFDQDGWWLGPPDVPLQELRFNFSTVNGNFRKAQTNVLPSNTVFLDLRKDPEDLLRSMRPKTRYNIGLSRRRGVQVRSVGVEKIDTWYRLYRETSRRNGIHLHDREYFRAVLSAPSRDTLSPADVDLLIAEAQGTALAAMFLVTSGHRASYLYGASSSSGRNLMAPYALQWEAILRAVARGCTEYDMFGVSPNPDPSHPLYGLHRFKTGFGGEIYHALGCWDYPLDEKLYRRHVGAEMGSRGYHRRG